MRNIDLLGAAACVLITVAAVILGAWPDLRPGRGEDEPRGKVRDDG